MDSARATLVQEARELLAAMEEALLAIELTRRFSKD